MAELSGRDRFETVDVAFVAAKVSAFGLPEADRVDPRARARLAALVEASAADARPPLASPHRWGRFVAEPSKALLRKLVWSRTGPALERQAEFNTAFIRVAAQMLSRQRSGTHPPRGENRPGISTGN